MSQIEPNANKGPQNSTLISSKPSPKKASSKKPKKSQTRASSSSFSLKPKRPFPTVGLEEALKIPLKIKELNGGNPWPPSDVAQAVTGGSHKVNLFFYLTAAARDYGLTEGTRDATKIALADIGRKYVYAGNLEAEREALQEAFFNVPIFKQVYIHYKGPALPELKYLGNTLQSEFDLPPNYHAEFHRLFQENCRFLQKHGAIGGEDGIIVRESQNDASDRVVTLASPTKGSSLRIFVALPFRETLIKDGFLTAGRV
jgi:hypothetical protein